MNGTIVYFETCKELIDKNNNGKLGLFYITKNICDEAINALENQEKIKGIIANANQWSKEDLIVKAQAFCDIEKILRSDEE